MLKRSSMERCSSAITFFLILRLVGLKNAYLRSAKSRAIQGSMARGSALKKKVSIPLEAPDKAQSSELFPSFHAKKLKSYNFLSFGPSCWNCSFQLPRLRAFQWCTACPSAAKKSCGSHLFGVGPGEADETAFVQQLSKTRPAFFCGRLMPFKSIRLL